MSNSSVSTAEHRAVFREDLLLPTVEHARQRVPAYRDLYRDVASPTQLSELPRLPIVKKRAMKLAPQSFRDDSLSTLLVQHTTGTTADPLVIHRSRSEVEFIENFQETAIRLRQPDEGGEPAPLAITFTGNYHGESTPSPYAGPVIALDLSDPSCPLAQAVADPAAAAGSETGHAILVGLEPQLRTVTCRLLESGFDFSSSKVIALKSTGDVITRRLRSWYESNWGAKLFDYYSMTEIYGAASHCHRCGFRHLEPTVIGEVVNPLTARPVSSGYGVLVITNLYPFVQQQPFIRYWTGDLVRLGPPCVVDDLSFELEGRLRACVLDETVDGVVPLISGAAIYDIMDDFPDVNSSSMYPEASGVSDHSALGKLKFDVEAVSMGDFLDIQIVVETRYPPYQYSERAAWLCHEIRERVIRRHPPLERRIREGSASLSCQATPRGRVKSFLPDWVE